MFTVVIRDTTERKRAEKAEAAARANAERLRELERELKSLERLSSHGKVSVTAEAFGLKSLREGAPDKFNEMVQHYNDLMDLALEQRSFKVEHNISNKLKALSEEMGFLRAGPRDVVEIHGTALKQKSSDTTPQKFQIYAEEGRVMVLELMGYLVSFYRSYSAGVGSAAPREGKKKNSNS